jgi:hypothetical protein
MKKKHFFLAIISLLLFSFAVLWITVFTNPILGKVGDYEITQQDVRYRNDLFHVYSPNEKASPGLEQLIKAFTYAQILKNNGHPITDDILKKEEQRIDQKTLVPEKLEIIKSIFKGDNQSYRKIFILPTYVERTIFYDFFLKDPAAQAASKKVASDFLDSVLKNPSRFSTLAQKNNLKTHQLFISQTEGVYFELPKELQDNISAGENETPEAITQELKKQTQSQKDVEAEKWIEEVINPLQVGQVFSQIIDNGEYWLVARLSKKPKKSTSPFVMESVTFPKADYSQWLEKETAKVKSTF